MIFRNETRYDGREARGILNRVAKDLDVYNALLNRWSVTVSQKELNGYPYSGTCAYSRRSVFLRLNKYDAYPMQTYHGYDRKDLPPLFVCENWQESLAAIAGHEFMHVRQWMKQFTGEKHNHRGRFNEVETQFAEYRAWKREHERTIKRLNQEVAA